MTKKMRALVPRSLLDDLLYSVGRIIDRNKYSGAEGFERFKAMLREHLETKTP